MQLRLSTASILIAAAGWMLAVGASGAEQLPADLGSNAALDYWQAVHFASKLDDLQRKVLDDFDKVPLDDAAAKVVEAGGIAIEFTRLGAQQPMCNWGHPLERDGCTVLLPHLRATEGLLRLMLLQARLEIRDGKGLAAVNDWVGTLAMSRHVSSDCLMISFLIGYQFDGMAIDSAAADLTRLDEPALSQLADSLQKLRPRPPLSAAVRVEQQTGQRWLIAQLRRKQDLQWRATFAAKLRNSDPKDPNAAILANFATPESLAQKLQELDPLVDQLEHAAAMPYDSFEQSWPALRKRLKANPTAQLVMIDDFGRVRRAQALAQARLALFEAAVDVVRGGPQRLEAHPDPFGTGPFAYVAAGEGFELRSKLLDKRGQPLTLKVGIGNPTN